MLSGSQRLGSVQCAQQEPKHERKCPGRNPTSDDKSGYQGEGAAVPDLFTPLASSDLLFGHRNNADVEEDETDDDDYRAHGTMIFRTAVPQASHATTPPR